MVEATRKYFTAQVKLLCCIGFMVLGFTAPALAGQGFNITIVNNGSSTLAIDQGATSNWNATVPTTSIPQTGQQSMYTEMSSFPGTSSSQFTISENNKVIAAVSLKGSYGSFTSWPASSANWVNDLVNTQYSGQISVASLDDGSDVVGGMVCTNADQVNCTLTVVSASFSLTNSKYGSGAITNARTYYPAGATLIQNALSDAVVFSSQMQPIFKVQVQSDGTLAYVNSAALRALGFTLQTPTNCPDQKNNPGTVLYVVGMDWSMYAIPICNRYIPNVPVVFAPSNLTGVPVGNQAVTAQIPSSSAGHVMTGRPIPINTPTTAGAQIAAIDIQFPFSQSIQNGYLALTHGGLSGGANVRCAGEMYVRSDGLVTEIDNDSGHYTPSGYALNAVIARFAAMGAKGAFSSTKSCALVGPCAVTGN